MRGRPEAQTNLISLVCAEDLISPGNPIRKIKRMVDEVLRAMSPVRRLRPALDSAGASVEGESASGPFLRAQRPAARRAHPHPALHGRRSDMGIRRTLAYKLSQKARKRVEPTFGCAKCGGGLRRVREIGIRVANATANLVFATGNLVRMARLETVYGGRA